MRFLSLMPTKNECSWYTHGVRRKQLSPVRNYQNSTSKKVQLSSSQLSATWKTEDSSVSLRTDNVVTILLIACASPFRKTKPLELPRGSSAPDKSFYSLFPFPWLSLAPGFPSSHPPGRSHKKLRCLCFLPACINSFILMKFYIRLVGKISKEKRKAKILSQAIVPLKYPQQKAVLLRQDLFITAGISART